MKKIFFASLLCLALAMPLRAAGPDAVTYQGNLLDTGGLAFPTGNYTMRFTFYDMPTGGTLRFQSSVAFVPVVDGIFTATIEGTGMGEVANLFRNFDSLYLELAIDTDNPANGIQADEVFSPRQRITIAPYAAAAGEADTATSAATATSATTAASAAYAEGANTANYSNSSGNALMLEGAGRAQFLEVNEQVIQTFGPNLNPNVSLTTTTGQPNNGAVLVQDANGNERASMLVSSDGSGTMAVRGTNGNAHVGLFSSGNLGGVEVYDTNGAVDGVFEALASGNGALSLYGTVDNNSRVALQTFPTGNGALQLFGANGNQNVLIANLDGDANKGAIAVCDAAGTQRAIMYVNAAGQGIFAGNQKLFVEDYPGRPGTKIVYVSLEGDEAGMYNRGVAHLVAGRATIELPEHFSVLALAESITVQLTPVSLDSKGVGVASISAPRIEIGELMGGTGSYDVHYVVTAKRAKHADHQVVQDSSEYQRNFGVAGPPEKVARARTKRVVPTGQK